MSPRPAGQLSPRLGRQPAALRCALRSWALSPGTCRALREEMYRASITRASSGDINNEPIIEKARTAFLSLKYFRSWSVFAYQIAARRFLRCLTDTAPH